MMRRARVLLAFASAALLAAPVLARQTVTGSGHAASAERDVSGYRGISVAVPAQVELLQGATEGLTLTADDNVLPLVKSSVAHGVLQLRFPANIEVRPRTPIRIVVRAIAIESVSLAGQVRLQSPRIEAPRLELKLAGSSSAALPELAAGEVSLHTSGHCHAMLGGEVDRLAIRMSGAGEVNAARLQARSASVSIAGSAQVAAWVRERLKVSVAGTGAVRYFGDPALAKSIHGSARIERLGAAPP